MIVFSKRIYSVHLPNRMCLHACLNSLQESRIYAVAKSGMRVSEAGPGARGPGRGEFSAARNTKLLILSI